MPAVFLDLAAPRGRGTDQAMINPHEFRYVFTKLVGVNSARVVIRRIARISRSVRGRSIALNS